MNSSYVLLGAVILILAVLNILQKKNSGKELNESGLNNPKKDGPLPYSKKEIMNSSEKAMYEVLKTYTNPKGYIIFSKIRLEDLVNVNVKEYKELQRYRGYIKSRHVDFVVCDGKMNVKLAIEVDGKSHNAKKVQETDEFKNRVFNTIGIPLYRIEVGTNYSAKLEKIFEEME